MRSKHKRKYAAYQQMGRGGFGLGGRDERGVSRGVPVGRGYRDVGPGGEAGVQTVPWPSELKGEERRPGREYGWGGVEAKPWGSCSRGFQSTSAPQPATPKDAPPPRAQKPQSTTPHDKKIPTVTPHDRPRRAVPKPKSPRPYDNPKSGSGMFPYPECDDVECNKVPRQSSPMPYAGFSYRGVRGRTFGCNDHLESPNYFGIKNAHEMEEYAKKCDPLIEQIFDIYGEIPQWLENDISVMRQQVGDVKHFLEFEHGARLYGHGPTGMAHENLHIIAQYSHAICSALKEIDHPMPTWASDKLAKARQIMSDVYHYMEYHVSDDGRQYGHPVSGIAFSATNTRSKKKMRRMGIPSSTRELKCLQFAFINGVWVCVKHAPSPYPGSPEPGETYNPVR